MKKNSRRTHRNGVIFRGDIPDPSRILTHIEEQYGRCWKFKENQVRNKEPQQQASTSVSVSSFRSTGSRNGLQPACVQIDGAWKKCNKKVGIEWFAGIGWWIIHEGTTIAGQKHVLASSPLQDEALELNFSIMEMETQHRRLEVYTDCLDLI